ncbi:MAG: RnfABCDGE type electron transport complex subunit G [Candidatus Omnitrophica bacterium]|nr:RnfABCDGE type electron transport complex subunit G [Candidatus Omnitrophota bacterium]
MSKTSDRANSTLRLVLALGLSSIIASAALAFVYQGTREQIIRQEREVRLTAIREVLPPFDNDPIQDAKEIRAGGASYTYYLGKEKGDIIGVAFSGGEMGYGGMLDVMIGVNPDGIVTGTVVLKHAETPGLGTKAFAQSFKNQYKGKNWEQVALTKDGGSIQAITGATITSRTFTKAIQDSVKRFLQNKMDILGLPSEAGPAIAERK